MTVRYENLKPCEPEYLEAIGIDRATASPVGATIAVLEASSTISPTNSNS